MATLLKVLNNLAATKSAGGVALRVRTQGPRQIGLVAMSKQLQRPHRVPWSTTKGRLPKAFPRHASARDPFVPQMPMFGALMDPEGACPSEFIVFAKEWRPWTGAVNEFTG